ncbi:MAG: tRNA pseudouridine(55) synthase TruB [Lachnospiraceae bacterium]|nr:tRNA pseudouridine(55) synthase TruB [Lachnospiraceae bacterium]
MDGIINIYKESGYTSHDVVARLRGILHIKKIGHTGTLDPEAVGVLPCCIGKGTKLVDLIADRTKEYEAVMRLGIRTDTEDMTGKILSQSEVNLTEDEISKVMTSFVGDIKQIPPMYSALKVNGKKLYELAREGVEIERKARDISIFKIEVIEINLPLVRFKLECSKGTYVRSLCRDIGEKLGCGASMQSLIRTRVGIYKIEDALKLDEVEAYVKAGKIENYIKAVDQFFDNLPKIVIDESLNKKADNGNSFFKNEIKTNEKRVLIYKADNKFIGIYYYDDTDKMFKPEKLFFI